MSEPAPVPAFDPAAAPEPPKDEGYPIDQQGITDLTNRRPRPRFRIGGEVYEGKVEVPAGIMLKFSARSSKLAEAGEEEEENFDETVRMFRLLLKRDSADRLIGHLHLVPPDATDEESDRLAEEADEDENAIGYETFMKLLPWLTEQYGMAPTEPSSNSADGSSASPDDGSDTTPTSPETESTSGTSLSTEPSTSSIG